MRPLLLLLLPAVAAIAEDPFEITLRVFSEARPRAFAPGSKSSIYPAVEAMVESRNPRAVEPLSLFLVDCIQAGDQIREQARKSQRRGADAFSKSQDLERELTVLRVREKSGATDVGPAIASRESELRENDSIFRSVAEEVGRLDRLVSFSSELRSKVAQGLAQLIGSLGEEKGAGAIAEVRRILDVAETQQSLSLVAILRESGLRAAAPHFAEVLQHPKAGTGTRRQAISGLGAVADAAGMREILRIAESEGDPLCAHALHVIGLAARQPLHSAAEARAWIQTLPK